MGPCPLTGFLEGCGKQTETQTPSEWREIVLMRNVPAETSGLYLLGSSLGPAVSVCTMKQRGFILGHTVSSWRRLWTGVGSQQPQLEDQILKAVPPVAMPTASITPGVGALGIPCLREKVPSDQ